MKFHLFILLSILLFPLQRDLQAAKKRHNFKYRFQELLQTFDFYKLPDDMSNVLTKEKLFRLLAQKGISIQTQKYNYDQSENNQKLFYKNFIPKLQLSSSYSLSQSYSDESKTNGKSKSANITLAGTSPWGISYNFYLPKISSSKSSNYYAGGSSDQSQSYSFGLGADISITLLKDSFFFLGNSSIVENDRSNFTELENLKSATLGAVYGIEGEFYQIFLKYVNLRITKYSYLSSQGLLFDTEQRYKLGEIGHMDVVKAKMALSQGESSLITTENDYNASLTAIRNTLSLEPDAIIYPDPREIKIIPPQPNVTIPESLELAYKYRSDYVIGLMSLENAKLAIRKANSSRWPSLSLSASREYSSSKEHLRSAMNKTLKLEKPSSSVGLSFSYTFPSYSEETAYQNSKIGLKVAKLAHKQLINNIKKEITSSVQSLDMAYRNLKATATSRELSEKELKGEFEKYKLGETSIRDLINSHSSVNQARSAEISAHVTVLQSLSSYYQSIGQLPKGLKFGDYYD